MKLEKIMSMFASLVLRDIAAAKNASVFGYGSLFDDGAQWPNNRPSKESTTTRRIKGAQYPESTASKPRDKKALERFRRQKHPLS